jgi:NAD(P)-dependent dehydrogenase (short-subunit alcohol dehydrogenase family)
MDLGLNGRVVVVTGGTGALGRAVVAHLLAEGARPVVTWRSERELRDFPAGDRVRLEKLDLADESAVDAFYRGLGGLWASVHLAGGFAMAPVENTSAADFLGMFATNTLSCFLCSREAVRAMRAGAGGAGAGGAGSGAGGAGSGAAGAGKGTGGRIVNVAARPALVPTGGMIAYSTSKAAVASLTQSLAEEVKPDGIWVNAVAPSLMDTPANRAAMPKADYSTWPKVEQVADAILFLASPANALTSGTVVPVYGKV